MVKQLLTSKNMMSFYQISRSTLYRRINEISTTEYKDAVIHDGPRRLYFDNNRWQEWLKDRSEKEFRRQVGIDDTLRNSTDFI